MRAPWSEAKALQRPLPDMRWWWRRPAKRRALRRLCEHGTVEVFAGLFIHQPGGIEMDHTNHVRLTTGELTPEILDGATVYGPGDEKVGSVAHTHGAGADMAVVIDVGGFLGIGAKPVAIKLADLDVMRDESGTVHAVSTWTKDELKALPEHVD